MSMAIDFAVRTVAGGTTYGQVAGPDQGNFIQTGAGDSISLNLRPESILSYRNVDGDLVIELADGRTILLADYFSTPNGVLNTLYLSTDGTITPITLTDVGNGIMSAELGPTSGWEKWSPLDDLRFTESDPVIAVAGEGTNEPAGMGMFVPGLLGAGGLGLGAAAAVVGGAAIIGGGGGGNGGGGGGGGGDNGGGDNGGGGGGGGGGNGGGGGGGPVRTVNDAGTSSTITTNTIPPSIAVTGTGRPGDTVEVTIGGQTQTATVGTDGNWSTNFSGPTLPADGNYTASAVFTGNGSTATLPGPAFVIDMTPPPITVTDGFQSTGDVENLAEYADGVTLTGTTEPGATVMITVNTPGSQPRAATVGADGSWSITLTQAEIAGGERTQGITITATDPLGNVRTSTETVVLDTVPPPLGLNTIAGDNIVNRSESQGSIVIGGTGTANTTITLTIEGIPGTLPITVDGNGNWSHSLSPGSFADGTYTRQITATTQDAAGNPTTITRTLNIDTQMAVDFAANPIAGDNVVNLSESNGTIALSGTVALDATRVEVQWLGQPIPATINEGGTWSLILPAGAAGSISRDNSTITVTAWDAAGNREQSTRHLRIDLETAVTMEPQPVGADNTLSGSERTAGLTLDGTAEPGARVFVTINGSERPAIIADDMGNWSIAFAPGDLPSGQAANALTFSAYSIDPAGNRSETITRNFATDTLVQDFGFSAPDITGTIADGPRDAQVLNATERSQGLVVQGTVEPGSTVTLQLGTWSTTIPASATQNGTWTYRIPESALPSGANTSATITATATDALGNTSNPLSQTIAIDTQVTDFSASQIRLGTGTDNILNAIEHEAGLPVSGRAEAGASIRVTIGTTTHDAIADSTGNWSVRFDSSELPTGERSGIPVSVTATDTAGNVSGPHVLTFDVDTVLPATPQVIETQDIAGVMRGISTIATTDSYSFHRVDATGAPQALTSSETYDAQYGEDVFRFQNATVPDGSYLVINTRDAAGNEANTLFIKNTATGVTVDLTRDGLDAFDFNTIDLTRAPDARLTISESQLRDLTGPDHTLLIKGESTDQVTLTGVTQVRQDVDLHGDGRRFDIYSLGNNGATVILEDDLSRTVV